ncbi:MAG: aryl-sulfate sulfotransferase [Tenericutes bacterium]|nr:aryl-sulfate sulfotransferase [Mycoplasmatota bacterium]
MKKTIFLGIIILSLLCGVIVGYFFVTGGEKVLEKKDILVYQSELENKFTSYGYTIDEPNIILNPYEISPLTALVMFETSDYVSPTVTVVGKSEKTTYIHTFKESKTHYLEILGLYPDYNNEVIISYGDVTKKIYIQTGKLPNDFVTPSSIYKDEDKLNNELYFYTPSSRGYTCAYDINGDVRWYLTENFIWEINRLRNGNLLLSTDKLINNPYYMTGLYEMDMLGKIYFEYNIDGGYHHDYFEMPSGNILVLSNNFANGTVEDYIVELDLKDGSIVKKFDLTDILPMDEGESENFTTYDWFHNNSIWYDEKTNSITLSGRHIDAVINISYDTGKLNWIIGDSTNYSSEWQKYFFKPIGDNFEWQWSQHSAKITPEGYVFIFDNGNNKSKIKEDYVDASNSYSRGVIYKIDTINMTIEQIWEYGKERGSDFYSPYISNVLYLEENHFVVHSGGIVKVNGIPYNYPAGLSNEDVSLKSDTVELLNNEVIYELVLPTNNYRVRKMEMYSNSEYKQGIGVRLGSISKTEESNKHTIIVKSKDIDNNYNKHNITFDKEVDRLVFSGTFLKDDKVKIILDKFLGKKEYDVIVRKRPYTAMCVDVFTDKEEKDGIKVTKYINNTGLNGKYLIYVSINGTIYKTNKYVEF